MTSNNFDYKCPKCGNPMMPTHYTWSSNEAPDRYTMKCYFCQHEQASTELEYTQSGCAHEWITKIVNLEGYIRGNQNPVTRRYCKKCGKNNHDSDK